MTHEIFVDKISRYVAYLQQQADVWYYEMDQQDMVDYFMEKIDTTRDICAIFGCIPEVWDRAKEIYDFTNSGRSGYTLQDGEIVREGSVKIE